MDILKILRDGVDVMADSYLDPREHNYPEKDGFLRDRAKLIKDVRQVGSDMKTTIDRYGEQQYESSLSGQERTASLRKPYFHR